MIGLVEKKELVYRLLDQGYLVSKNSIEKLQEIDTSKISDKCLVINEKSSTLAPDTSWQELDNAIVHVEKGRANVNISDLHTEHVVDKTKYGNSINVVFSYDKKAEKKREIKDFVQYFNKRYEAIKKILKQRQELQNCVSIARVYGRREKDTASIIGIVMDKRFSKNGHLMLTIEDKTGSIRVLVSKNKPAIFEEAKHIVLDEVIGVTGNNGDKIVFADKVFWPDVPVTNELKKHTEEDYAIFMSDMHVGSKYFMKEEFDKFLKWINAKVGSDGQKVIAKKVKYIFISGDLVDGCGIYPGQEEELEITDIYEQYAECAKLLSQIPKEIKIIICPGNHDAMRIAEPQPKFYEDFSKPILDLPNATIVSNPSVINIGATETFQGFNVLLYHGASFDYYVSNVEYLRAQGGYHRADLIMKFLLKRRHLAPSHTSTLYIPETSYDPLMISNIPDFFVTGHIHNAPIVTTYRGVHLISAGCWQSTTKFQEKVGHEPGPCRVALANLKTRQVKILRFG